MYFFSNLVDDIAYLPPPGSCLWNSRTLENNVTWQHECNTCVCNGGIVKCTKIWCGIGNCRSSNQQNSICNLNQVCVPSPAESCLSPPCLPYGECRELENGELFIWQVRKSTTFRINFSTCIKYIIFPTKVVFH